MKVSSTLTEISHDDDRIRQALNLVKAISLLMVEIIQDNQLEEKDLSKHSIFSAKKPPSISILNYFERIIKYTQIEKSTLILILIFIDRLCDKSNLQMNSFNIHRLILTSSVIAIKYNEDDYFSNTYYAKVGGISLQELNLLENEFLKMINYSLFVEREIFNKYKIYLKHYQQ